MAKTTITAWIVTLLLGMVSAAFAGPAVQVTGVKAWSDQEATRIAIDLSAEVKYKVFTLPDPPRVIIDLQQTGMKKGAAGVTFPAGPITGLRRGVQNGTDLRLVLDLSRAVVPQSEFTKASQGNGSRLVIALPGGGAPVPAVATAVTAQLEAKASAPSSPSAAPAPAPTPPAQAEEEPPRDIIVVIDAGHGGKDVGAVGASGTYEKDVVLDVARQLAALVNREPGMKAVMTREGDYFLKLRARTRVARENKADLFISIHADAFHNKRAQGSSVFALSDRGASSEFARLLADRENASDLVGGVSLDDKDDVLRSVLLDLSQTGTIKESLDVGGRVLERMGKLGKLHKSQVEQAGFAVLKSHDVPSLLVELAFISNPAEERKLRDDGHQRQMAASILAGVREYFVSSPPPGTLLARLGNSRHVIRSGETLSGIASRYQVSMQDIKSANALQGDAVHAGQVLRIPGRDDG